LTTSESDIAGKIDRIDRIQQDFPRRMFGFF